MLRGSRLHRLAKKAENQVHNAWYLKTALYICSVIGFMSVAILIAMQFGVLNVRGSASDRNNYFNSATTKIGDKSKLSKSVLKCQAAVLGNFAPVTAQSVERILDAGRGTGFAEAMLVMAEGQFDTEHEIHAQFIECLKGKRPAREFNKSAYVWANSEEWTVLRAAFIRDQEIIRKAADDAGISPRILLGGVIGEQFRFFTNSREAFKGYFEPLKLLASLSKFSFGIAGLKPETVALIDANLKNDKSPFYLGQKYESLILYPANSNHDEVRFKRITDTENPYYAYLYVGLFMRQVSEQWETASYSIADNPGVLATLYNLGFNRSRPKPNPQPGGAEIAIDGTTYTFGQIAEEFYFSGELLEEFPPM